MKGMAWRVLVTLAVLIPGLGFSQEIKDFDYQVEWVGGLAKNTYSRILGSVYTRYSRRAKEGQYHTFILEIANVKHPQEFKQGIAGNSGFIIGKSNYLFPVRLQYGREWILFNKAPEQGVQINFQVAGGPTLGFESPYYILYFESGSVIREEQYDPSVHTSLDDIQGSSGPFRGLGEAVVVPGGTLKAAFTFEFGTFKSRVSGIEVGAMIEGFSRPIVMLPRARNIQFFPSAYIGLYYGLRN